MFHHHFWTPTPHPQQKIDEVNSRWMGVGVRIWRLNVACYCSTCIDFLLVLVPKALAFQIVAGQIRSLKITTTALRCCN